MSLETAIRFATQKIFAMTCLWEYCTEYDEDTKVKGCFEYFEKRSAYGSLVTGHGMSNKDTARDKVKDGGGYVCVVNDMMMDTNKIIKCNYQKRDMILKENKYRLCDKKMADEKYDTDGCLAFYN